MCRNHLILGEHLSKSLEGQDYNMHGGAVMRTKGNNVRMRVDTVQHHHMFHFKLNAKEEQKRKHQSAASPAMQISVLQPRAVQGVGDEGG